MWGIFSSLGSFFRLRWRGILVIVVGILIVLGVWSYKSSIQEWTRAKIGYNQVQQALKEQKQAMKELQRQNELVIKINKQYREKIQDIRNDMVEVSNEIEKLERQNKKVADWADNSAPPAVINSLRVENAKSGNKNGNTESNATKEVSSTNQTSETQGNEE